MELNVPIIDEINKYISTNPIVFHMPGHKLGEGIEEQYKKDILRLDVTEIPGLDNLHYPIGAIKIAQELASRAFGADRSFFLVNGATCGIHAIIMTLCRPGERLLISRDCHKSIIHGMMLAGVEPVFLQTEYNNDFEVSTGVTPQQLDELIKKNSDVKGILITRPNYYGICSDIRELSKVACKYDKVLAVDEAHGAHLKFHSRLPEDSMSGGADICVQSAHKTLPALTQGAYLHVKSNKIDLDRLKFNLEILQTSSPSYIIMAFLDIARAIMEYNGHALLDSLHSKIDAFISEIKLVEDIDILSDLHLNDMKHDLTRLVLNFKKLGISGFEVEKILRRDYNLQVEMSDMFNVICIATISDTKVMFDRLIESLTGICRQYRGYKPYKGISFKNFGIPKMGMDLRRVMNSDFELIRLKEAVGRISNSTITPYPPGIPLIFPGEIISRDVAEYILEIIGHGGCVNGIEENLSIRVVK